MSFSKSTPHFGFPQYQDNDPQSVPQWNTDITEAFAKIDDVLYTSQDKADQAIGGVQTATEAATNAEASAQEASETATEVRNSLVVATPTTKLRSIQSWINAGGLSGEMRYTLPADGWYVFQLTVKSSKHCIAYINTPVGGSQIHFRLIDVDAREAPNPLGFLGVPLYLVKGEYLFGISSVQSDATGFSIFKVENV